MLLEHDKMLGEIHVKLDSFTISLKEQLSFNKKLENQVANFKSQVAYHEKVNAVTMRGGKATRDPPYPEPIPKKNNQNGGSRRRRSSDCTQGKGKN